MMNETQTAGNQLNSSFNFLQQPSITERRQQESVPNPLLGSNCAMMGNPQTLEDVSLTCDSGKTKSYASRARTSTGPAR